MFDSVAMPKCGKECSEFLLTTTFHLTTDVTGDNPPQARDANANFKLSLKSLCVRSALVASTLMSTVALLRVGDHDSRMTLKQVKYHNSVPLESLFCKEQICFQ